MSVSQCVQTLPLTFHANELGPPMYQVSDSVRSTHGQDGAVVLDIRQGHMFNLNRVGSRVLELLQAGSKEPNIVDAISREFSADRELVEKDVHEFFRKLAQYRLVESR
jgi:hypothetical protein